MKLKIRVKCSEGICFPTDLDKGDWIDLHASRSVRLKKGKMCIIPLGVAMKLPEGFEAHILPRSSTPKKFNILSYCCLNVFIAVGELFCYKACNSRTVVNFYMTKIKYKQPV